MITALAAVLFAAPAAAAHCLPREQLVARLTDVHSKQQVGIGVGPGGLTVYELWLSESGTWTIVFTRPNGITCVAASGNGWVTSPPLTGHPL